MQHGDIYHPRHIWSPFIQKRSLNNYTKSRGPYKILRSEVQVIMFLSCFLCNKVCYGELNFHKILRSQVQLIMFLSCFFV
jgi:adenosylmethionine-8-amino-7-oxononanoate aminotransferase